MRESTGTAILCKALHNDCGAFVVSIVAGTYGGHGIPDRHVSSRIWSGFIELKTKRHAMGPLQRETMVKINTANPGSCYCVRILDNQTYDIENREGEVIGAASTAKSLLTELALLRETVPHP